MATFTLNLRGDFLNRLPTLIRRLETTQALTDKLTQSVARLSNSYGVLGAQANHIAGLSTSFRTLLGVTNENVAAIQRMILALRTVSGLQTRINVTQGYGGVVLPGGGQAAPVGGGGARPGYYPVVGGQGAVGSQGYIPYGSSAVPYTRGNTYRRGGFPYIPYVGNSTAGAYTYGAPYGADADDFYGGRVQQPTAVDGGRRGRGGDSGGRRGYGYPRGVNVGRGIPFIPFFGSPGLLAAYGGALALGSGISTASRFETNLARVAAIEGEDIDSPGIQDFGNRLRATAVNSLFTATDYFGGVSKLVRGGVNRNSALNQIKSLEAITLLDPSGSLEKSADLALNIYKRHGVDVDDPEQNRLASDLLVHTLTKTRLGLSDLSTNSRYILRLGGLPQSSLAGFAAFSQITANAAIFGSRQFRPFTRELANLFNDRDRAGKLTEALGGIGNFALNNKGQHLSYAKAFIGYVSALADYNQQYNALSPEEQARTLTGQQKLKAHGATPTSIGLSMEAASSFANLYPEYVGKRGDVAGALVMQRIIDDAKGLSEDAERKVEDTAYGSGKLLKSAYNEWETQTFGRGSGIMQGLRISAYGITEGFKGLTYLSKYPLGKGHAAKALLTTYDDITDKGLSEYITANPDKWRKFISLYGTEAQRPIEEQVDDIREFFKDKPIPQDPDPYKPSLKPSGKLDYVRRITPHLFPDLSFVSSLFGGNEEHPEVVGEPNAGYNVPTKQEDFASQFDSMQARMEQKEQAMITHNQKKLQVDTLYAKEVILTNPNPNGT